MASKLNSNTENPIPASEVAISKSSQKSRKKRNKSKTEPCSPQIVGSSFDNLEYIGQCLSWARNEDRGLLAAKFRETPDQINSLFTCPGLTVQVTANLVGLLTTNVFTKPSKSSKEVFKQIYTTLIHSQFICPGGPLDSLIEQSFDANLGCETRIKHLTNIVHLFEVLINKLPEKLHCQIEYSISNLIDRSESCPNTSSLPHELKERLKGISTILKKLRSSLVSVSSEPIIQSTEFNEQIDEFVHSSEAVGKDELSIQDENSTVRYANTFETFQPNTLPINRENTGLEFSTDNRKNSSLSSKVNENSDTDQIKKITNKPQELTTPFKDLETALTVPLETSPIVRNIQSIACSKLAILPRNKSDIIPKKLKPPIQNVFSTPSLYINYLFEQLREESLFPIRKSLSRYFSRERKSIYKYIYVYENVRCRGLSCSDKDGIVINISFSPVGVKNPKKYNWINSKRLRLGSIICIFTKSKKKHCFDKIHFATIVNRNSRELNKWPCISIRFEDGNPLGFDPSLEYAMIESKFSHFKHLHTCLTALLSIDIDAMPLQDILLNQSYNTIPKSCSKSGTTIGDWEVDKSTLDSLQYSSIKFALTNHIALFKAPNLLVQYNTTELLIKIYLQNRNRVLQSLPVKLSYDFDERIILERLADIRSRLGLELDMEFYRTLCLSPLLVILPDTQSMDSFLEQIHKTENNYIRLNSRNSTNKLLATKSFFEVIDRSLKMRDLPSGVRNLKSKINSLHFKLSDYRRNLWEVSRCILKSKSLTESNIQQVVSGDVYESLFRSNISKPKDMSLIDYWLANGTNQPTNIVSTDSVNIEIPEAIISADHTVNQSNEYTVPPIDVTYQVSDTRGEFDDEFFYGDFDPSSENASELEAQFCNYSLDEVETGMEQSDSEYSDSEESESTDLENDFFDEILEESLIKNPQNQIQTESLLDTKLNVWEIELTERVKLYELWESRYHGQLFENLVILSEGVNKLVADISTARSQLDTYAMKQVTLIATTPVEGVKFYQQLKQTKPRIVIIHSACYLRESELIAMLTNSVKHLIIFDELTAVIPKDSKSLNPNCLVQRLVKSDCNHFSLLPDLVMRPEIAALIQSYVDVKTDPNLPNVMGVSENLFFVNSLSPESCVSRQGTDFTNEHEASFLVQFTKYLLKQGYSEKDISIYTFYPAQRSLINSLLRKVNISSGLKLSLVIPSAKRLSRISLVSLVRSNKHSDIGILNDAEMVYTAFSSASEGLFVIGDAECIRASKSCPMIWEIILDEFRSKLNQKLPLSCQAHNNITLVSKDKDFKKVRNGGCFTPCSVQLSCGHICPQICHPDPHTGTECLHSCGDSAIGAYSDIPISHIPVNCDVPIPARNTTSYQDYVPDENQSASW